MENKNIETLVDEYLKKLNETISKINNNIEYVDSYEGSFIAEKILKYLENMLAEYEKTKKLVEEYKNK